MMDKDVAGLVGRLERLVIMDEVGSDNPLGREAASTIRELDAKLREAVEVIKALCRAHETLRVHHGDLPGTSHSVNDGLDFLATMEKPQEDSTSDVA